MKERAPTPAPWARCVRSYCREPTQGKSARQPPPAFCGVAPCGPGTAAESAVCVASGRVGHWLRTCSRNCARSAGVRRRPATASSCRISSRCSARWAATAARTSSRRGPPTFMNSAEAASGNAAPSARIKENRGRKARGIGGCRCIKETDCATAAYPLGVASASPGKFCNLVSDKVVFGRDEDATPSESPLLQIHPWELLLK